jgi:tRNA nucleotidyltransferase (CCA-adding enzyme)
LGRRSKDIDIEVYGVNPDQLASLLQNHGKIDQVGKSFGVFKVSSPELEEPIDVSIPRRESKVGKGHKGFMIEADPTMTEREAAKRRDLTINSLAYDPVKKEIIDPFGGLIDIRDRRLKATDPETFKDDSLRVLRVMRFAAQLGFTPDAGLVNICRNIDLSDLPKERVFGELSGMLLKARYPSMGLKLIPLLGVDKILPELEELRGVMQEPAFHPEGDVLTHTLLTIDEAAKLRGQLPDKRDQLAFMLAVLFHDLGKPETTEVKEGKITTHAHDSVGANKAAYLLSRLTDEQYILDKVQSLIQNHLRPTEFYQAQVPDSAIRRLAKKVDIPTLVMVSVADKRGRGLEPNLEAERWLMKRFKDLKLEHPETLDPKVKGRHLIPLGIAPGPEMGKLLDKIYNAQLEGKFETTEEGLTYAEAQGWLLKSLLVKQVEESLKKSVKLVLNPEKVRLVVHQIHKARRVAKSLIKKEMAIGDIVLLKGGYQVKVTAVGEDGITARNEFGKRFKVFNGNFNVISQESSLIK